MPLILDAFNVMHAWRTGPARGTLPDLRALAALCRRPPFSREDATLVCDGASPDPDQETFDLEPGVVAVFAGPGRDADSAIERMIAASTAPARLIVVSSDRRIEKAARRRGCRTLASEAFVGIAVNNEPSRSGGMDEPIELDQREIEEWMKRFGMPVSDQPAPPARPAIDRPTRDRKAEPRVPDSIDPAELDMERWLRDYPPPKPGMDRGPASD